MSNKTKPDEGGAPAKPPHTPTDFPMQLEEFCRRASEQSRGVELIGAFHAHEKAAGRGKDTEAGFAARFESFARAPAG